MTQPLRQIPAALRGAPMPWTDAPQGYSRSSAYDLVPPSRARHVVVHPLTPTAGHAPFAGPLLPDWQDRGEVAHGNAGVPARVQRPGGGPIKARLGGTWIWGGALQGGLPAWVSETANRILPGREVAPDAPVVLAGLAGTDTDTVPHEFAAYLAWLGVDRSQVRLISAPTVVEDLVIAPQPEQAQILGPSYAYLRLLARTAAARGLRPKRAKCVYQERGGGPDQGHSPLLGEAYLCDRLRALGVDVVPHQGGDLRDRLARYAGAATLVMADGPGLRLRQMLGYYEQRIVILPSVARARPGLSALQPRCASMIYADTARGTLGLVGRDGATLARGQASVLDCEPLLQVFEDLGVPLRRVWDDGAWRAALACDVTAWMAQARAGRDPQVDWPQSATALHDGLREMGFLGLLPEIDAHLSDWTRAPP